MTGLLHDVLEVGPSEGGGCGQSRSQTVAREAIGIKAAGQGGAFHHKSNGLRPQAFTAHPAALMQTREQRTGLSTAQLDPALKRSCDAELTVGPSMYGYQFAFTVLVGF